MNKKRAEINSKIPQYLTDYCFYIEGKYNIALIYRQKANPKAFYAIIHPSQAGDSFEIFPNKNRSPYEAAKDILEHIETLQTQNNDNERYLKLWADRQPRRR